MKFLIDTQLPKVLVGRLLEAGYEVAHVLDLNLAQSPDNDLWHHAAQHGFAILTKDEDFAQWVLTGREGPAVVWLRIGNCTNGELLEWLIPVLPKIVEAFDDGDRLVEVA